MELLYLLCSIASTVITSIVFSLLLPFNILINRCCWWLSRSRRYHSHNPIGVVSLYEGKVWHERHRPTRHSFQYSVRYALIDLDHAPHVPPGHLTADQARNFAHTHGPVSLLTIPPSVGYEQNPLSIYYCYNEEGTSNHLHKCIAEVTNTPWGERVLFVFNPESDLIAKPLHVSPFMDMLGSWSIKANAPGDDIFVVIAVQHPRLGDYFTATLRVKRASMLTSSYEQIFFWLMPHKVAVWIYLHAFKLWWKGVPFIQHPRYTNPAYRDEAMTRDRKQCNEAAIQDGSRRFKHDGVDSVKFSACNSSRDRCFAWRDAKWPWC